MSKSKYTNQYRLSAYISLIGLFMVLAMIIVILTSNPVSLNTPNSADIITDGIKKYENISLILLIIDTGFIIGFSGFFTGLYLLTRDISPLLAKMGYLMGMGTVMFDLLENATQIMFIKGVNLGWEPEFGFYAFLWAIRFIIDLLSYISAVYFGTILYFNYPVGLKKIIGALFGVYTIVGLVSIVSPLFGYIRLLLFAIGLGLGTYIFLQEPEITLDMLMDGENNESGINYE